MTAKEEVEFYKQKLASLRKTYRKQVRDLGSALTKERLAHQNTILRYKGFESKVKTELMTSGAKA